MAFIIMGRVRVVVIPAGSKGQHKASGDHNADHFSFHFFFV
jgi:hypothetical protein